MCQVLDDSYSNETRHPVTDRQNIGFVAPKHSTLTSMRKEGARALRAVDITDSRVIKDL